MQMAAVRRRRGHLKAPLSSALQCLIHHRLYALPPEDRSNDLSRIWAASSILASSMSAMILRSCAVDAIKRPREFMNLRGSRRYLRHAAPSRAHEPQCWCLRHPRRAGGTRPTRSPLEASTFLSGGLHGRHLRIVYTVATTALKLRIRPRLH